MNATDEIRRRIVTSFEDADRPAADDVVTDRSGHDLEAADVREAFAPHAWREVPFETLVERDSALSFMTPEGFRYYIPAYMVAVLDRFEESDVLPANVVHYLTLPAEVDSRIREYLLRESSDGDADEALMEELRYSDDDLHRFVERVSGFDAEQGGAIRNFLEHLQTEHGGRFGLYDPETAVYRYWFVYD